MKKSSIIPKQIKSLKERKQFDTLWDTKPSLLRININFKKLSADPYENQVYLKYIVVNLVSILESFTRSAVKNLIDKGEPYIDNSKYFFDTKLKMDFDSFRNIHNREFTFGEFVSHQVSCSNLEHVLEIFKIILGSDLFEFLKRIDISNPNMKFKHRVKNYIDDYDINNKAIQKIFELRHIICHENSLRLDVDEKEVRQGYGAISSLLNICGDAILYTINPILFMSFKEQITLNKKHLENQKSNLKTLLIKIKENPQTILDEKIDINLFIESQDLWERFSEKHAQTMSNVTLNFLDTDKNMYSSDEIRLNHLIELNYMYEERIEDLMSEFITSD